jgi:hypothetical protein
MFTSKHRQSSYKGLPERAAGGCMRMRSVYSESAFRLEPRSWIWGSGTGAWAKRLRDASYAVTACDFEVPKERFKFP